ncbi:MAG: hypothetical protein NMNS01_03510 [Nitrosomonas sp.]|nr:MAG: hypothetical protein NMNS01_03510 [Nitrosomonas sp.]
MKQEKLEWIMIAAVGSLFIVGGFHVKNAYAVEGIDDFVGEYACSFEN